MVSSNAEAYNRETCCFICSIIKFKNWFTGLCYSKKITDNHNILQYLTLSESEDYK